VKKPLILMSFAVLLAVIFSAPLFADEQVNEIEIGGQFAPSVQFTKGENYIITWDGGKKGYTSVRRYNGNGTPASGEDWVGNHPPYWSWDSKSDANSSGYTVIVWAKQNGGSMFNGQFQGFFQILDDNGNKIGGPTVFTEALMDFNVEPDVVVQEDGSFTVVWEQYYYIDNHSGEPYPPGPPFNWKAIILGPVDQE
jgi:hypothetical protein